MYVIVRSSNQGRPGCLYNLDHCLNVKRDKLSKSEVVTAGCGLIYNLPRDVMTLLRH